MTDRPDLPPRAGQDDTPTPAEFRRRIGIWREVAERSKRAARESEVRRVALEGEVERLGQELQALQQRAETEHAEAERLRREIAAAHLDVERARQLSAQRRREAERALNIAVLGLRSVRDDVERIGASTAWRIGHRTSRAFNRVRLRRPVTGGAVLAARARIDEVIEILSGRGGEASAAEGAVDPAPDDGPRHSAENKRALATRVRDRLGPVPERLDWPPVSIVVLNRNGAALLAPLLDGLSATDYPTAELVVIDHASTDGSIELLERAELPFPVRVRREQANLTFAASCNEGAELAAHRLLLFLNNDVEPFEPGWLKELVDTLLVSDSAAVGATLAHTTVAQGADASPSGVSVQHRGIRLERDGPLALPRNVDDGADLFDQILGTERPCIAATGACLLVQRDSFERAGGFDTSYRYGYEDVDLAFSLIAAGERVICSGRAVLFHEEAATQRTIEREARRLNRLVNSRRLEERWGPALRREMRVALARRDRVWVGDETLHVVIARVSNDPAHGSGDHYTALELGTALEQLGWRVGYLQRGDDEWYSIPRDTDVVVALTHDFDARRLPSWVTAVAWIRNWTDRWLEAPWLDRYEILLASSPRTAAMIAAANGRQATLFPLATNPSRFRPAVVDPKFESDYTFTGHRWGEERALERALNPHSQERLALYGKGWEQVTSLRSYTRGPVKYEKLPAVYASSHVVVDDAASPTLRYDAVNSRVFDALATGTPVITNCEAGAKLLFDDDFPVWSDSNSLRSQLDLLLGDPLTRQRLARRYRRKVLTEHTYSHRAERLRELIQENDQALSFCLKIGAPDWERAARWGDQYFAQDLARALKRLGHRCLIQVLPEWDDPAGMCHDVVIHLRGRSTYSPRPSQLNILWLISHPDELSVEEAESYDLVCVASSIFAERLRQQVRVPITVLDQATDPWRFFGDPDPALAHELVFVGNTRGTRRRLLDELLPVDHDLAVWGTGMDGTVPTRYLQGDWFPNEELRRVYSSAKITLCDHWDDMREHGFVSNRVYDAVACGTVVVSDAVPEIAERFGDAVITYETAEELRQIVDRLLSSDEERRRRALGARERILRGHTFDHRASELLRLVAEHLGASGHRARIAAA